MYRCYTDAGAGGATTSHSFNVKHWAGPGDGHALHTSIALPTGGCGAFAIWSVNRGLHTTFMVYMYIGMHASAPMAPSRSHRCMESVLCLSRCMYWDVAAYALSCSKSLKQVSNGSDELSAIPTKAEHHKENPTARGPVSVKLGFPMATAYTTATSRKVIMNSQPKAIPWNSPSIITKMLT